jgi:hypothetical protein
LQLKTKLPIINREVIRNELAMLILVCFLHKTLDFHYNSRKVIIRKSNGRVSCDPGGLLRQQSWRGRKAHDNAKYQLAESLRGHHFVNLKVSQVLPPEKQAILFDLKNPFCSA